jgi:hypothetical protein
MAQFLLLLTIASFWIVPSSAATKQKNAPVKKTTNIYLPQLQNCHWLFFEGKSHLPKLEDTVNKARQKLSPDEKHNIQTDYYGFFEHKTPSKKQTVSAKDLQLFWCSDIKVFE